LNLVEQWQHSSSLSARVWQHLRLAPSSHRMVMMHNLDNCLHLFHAPSSSAQMEHVDRSRTASIRANNKCNGACTFLFQLRIPSVLATPPYSLHSAVYRTVHKLPCACAVGGYREGENVAANVRRGCAFSQVISDMTSFILETDASQSFPFPLLVRNRANISHNVLCCRRTQLNKQP
jgi:hypothetical protein